MTVMHFQKPNQLLHRSKHLFKSQRAPLPEARPVSAEETVNCDLMSYLPPVAIDPLWTRARLTGPLLIGPAAILTAVGRVAVLVLAHDHAPLESSRTRAGALFNRQGGGNTCK